MLLDGVLLFQTATQLQKQRDDVDQLACLWSPGVGRLSVKVGGVGGKPKRVKEYLGEGVIQIVTAALIIIL